MGARKHDEGILSHVTEALIARNKSHSETIAEVVQEFGVHKRTAKRYIGYALKNLRESSGPEAQFQRNKLRVVAEFAAARQLELKHWKSLCSTLKFLSSLDGLDAPQQLSIDHSGLREDGELTSTESILRRVAELRARTQGNGKLKN